MSMGWSTTAAPGRQSFGGSLLDTHSDGRSWWEVCPGCKKLWTRPCPMPDKVPGLMCINFWMCYLNESKNLPVKGWIVPPPNSYPEALPPAISQNVMVFIYYAFFSTLNFLCYTEVYSKLTMFLSAWSLLLIRTRVTGLGLCFCPVAQSCSTLCNRVGCSTPGFPVLCCLAEFARTHTHWVSDAIQPSPLLPPSSPPDLNPSQHQGLFQWVISLHQAG